MINIQGRNHDHEKKKPYGKVMTSGSHTHGQVQKMKYKINTIIQYNASVKIIRQQLPPPPFEFNQPVEKTPI